MNMQNFVDNLDEKEFFDLQKAIYYRLNRSTLRELFEINTRLNSDEILLINEGKTIAAIKAYRLRTNCSLRAAKMMVDDYKERAAKMMVNPDLG